MRPSAPYNQCTGYPPHRATEAKAYLIPQRSPRCPSASPRTTHRLTMTWEPRRDSREPQPFSGTCLSGGLIRHALLDRLLQSRQHILTPRRRLALLSEGEGVRANVAVLA